MRSFNPARLATKYGPLSEAMMRRQVECFIPDGASDCAVMQRYGAPKGAEPLRVMIRARGTYLFTRMPAPVYKVLPGRDTSEVCDASLTTSGVNPELGDAAFQRFWGLVPDPGWARDERVEKDAIYARLGWRALSDDAARFAWTAFDPIATASVESGQEPQPSMVWDIASVYAESEGCDSEPDLTAKTLSALKACTRPGESWFVFSDFANVISFDPWLMDDEVYRSSWRCPVLPRGDFPHYDRRTNHTCFLSPDFGTGILTYLQEDSLCVFGQPLLDAFESSRPSLFKKLRRSHGRS
jgi:hypothetical protein